METLSTPIQENHSHFMQIDLLKGVMILLVMIDHAIPWGVRDQWGHSLWERIAIPVFMIIMGFNSANSFRTKGIPLQSFAALLKYYWEKTKRFVFPFLFIYIVFTLLGVFYFYDGLENLFVDHFDLYWGRINLYLLIPPFSGPGDWFIIVLFESIFILPFLYWIYKKAPRITLFLSFIFEIGVQELIFSIFGYYLSWPSIESLYQRYFFQCSVLLFISPLILGFWIADHKNLGTVEQNQRNHLKWYFYLGLLVLIVGYVLLMKFVLIERLIPSFLTSAFLRNFSNKWHLISSRPRISEGIFIMFLIILLQIYLAIFLYRPRWRYFFIILPLTIGSLVAFLYTNANYMKTSTYEDPNYGSYYLALLIFLWPVLINILSRFKAPLNSNWFLWICAPVSGFYLILYQFSSLRYFNIAGDYHFLVYPHSAFIILFVLAILPNISLNPIVRGFQYVGKASYHILLTQMMYFGIMIWRYYSFEFNMTKYKYYRGGILLNLPYILAVWVYVLTAWLICVPIGILWYFIEQKFYLLVAHLKNKKKQQSQVEIMENTGIEPNKYTNQIKNVNQQEISRNNNEVPKN